MKTVAYTYIGIDVSKKTLDVFAEGKHSRIGNNPEELSKYAAGLAARKTHGVVPFVVCEATGKGQSGVRLHAPRPPLALYFSDSREIYKDEARFEDR